MKKNKMMRIASVLLIAVLATTSVISGTFAKYVTSDKAQDTARVAKFGVTVTASGKLFADTYKKTANIPGAAGDNMAADGESIVLSVISTGATAADSDVDNVVAPGTKSSDDGLKISVAGTPEVAVRVAFALKDASGNNITTTGTAEDVFLKATTGNAAYADMTTGAADDFFANAADYYPVKYTLKIAGSTVVDKGTLAQVVTKLRTLSSADYKAGTNLATVFGDVQLTWEWDFDNSGAGTYDKQDTLLGDLAANSALTAKTADSTADPIVWSALTSGMANDYNLKTGIGIEVSVTQID